MLRSPELKAKWQWRRVSNPIAEVLDTVLGIVHDILYCSPVWSTSKGPGCCERFTVSGQGKCHTTFQGGQEKGPGKLQTGKANLSLWEDYGVNPSGRQSWAQEGQDGDWEPSAWPYQRQIMPDQDDFWIWQAMGEMQGFQPSPHNIPADELERYGLNGELQGGQKTDRTTWFKWWSKDWSSTGGEMLDMEKRSEQRFTGGNQGFPLLS